LQIHYQSSAASNTAADAISNPKLATHVTFPINQHIRTNPFVLDAQTIARYVLSQAMIVRVFVWVVKEILILGLILIVLPFSCGLTLLL
jgi:hypothetical protein